LDFIFSKHAIKRIQDRNIDEEIISLIIQNPDSIIEVSDCKHIYQKKLQENDSKYLYRVFLNVCKNPNLIITAYKTSNIDKYL